jgi:pyruvate-formate lyase-activating enzyme
MAKATLIFADQKGKIFEHSGIEAAAMKAGKLFRIPDNELIELPLGSQLFALPRRQAIGYDRSTGEEVTLEGSSAVGAFLAPGYTATYSPAYSGEPEAKPLPLFSYCAAVTCKGKTCVTAVRVDSDKRHDQTLIDIEEVGRRTKELGKLFKGNRLIRHLETCALSYGCPNAQNFFLSRHECPLPTAPLCNAACAGCISSQPAKDICASQPRIKFVPTPEEISEIALYHISKVKTPVLSFGQGCEGEPLTAADIVDEAIRSIRRSTRSGTINMNTNGSRPEAIERLIDAGLDSVRISLNSANAEYYARYYKPHRYKFADVVESARLAKRRGIFVSLNYLTMPGLTDSRKEFSQFKKLLRRTGADMVQWRNLNYDPLIYFRLLKADIRPNDMIGIRQEMDLLKKEFPKLHTGYFNPSLKP